MSDHVTIVCVILASSVYLLWRARTLHRRMKNSANYPRKNLFQTALLAAIVALASLTISQLILRLTWTEVFIRAGLATIAVVIIEFLYGRFR